MDFTYSLAPIFAVVAGLIAQMIRLLTRRRWSKRSASYAFACALAVNGMILLNWPHLLDWGLAFAAMDLSIIAALTVIGFSAIAPGALMALFRK